MMMMMMMMMISLLVPCSVRVKIIEQCMLFSPGIATYVGEG